MKPDYLTTEVSDMDGEMLARALNSDPPEEIEAELMEELAEACGPSSA